MRKLAFTTNLAIVALVLAVSGSIIPALYAQFPGMPQPKRYPWSHKASTPDQRADLVMKEMTLNEKISLLHGQEAHFLTLPVPNGGRDGTSAIPRLGIPAIQMADSSYGVTRGAAAGRHVTALPNNLAAASSWGPDMGELKVRIIDRAGVPESQWRIAAGLVQTAFAKASIRFVWERCHIEGSSGTEPRCTADTTPDEIQLTLVPEGAAKQFEVPQHAFAMAKVPLDGSWANNAYVFYSRVDGYCGEHHQVNEALLLGSVMAHEIGHLLLGYHSHTASGMMKPLWTDATLAGNGLASLQFSRTQNDELRQAVAKRLAADEMTLQMATTVLGSGR